jgi:hypothetical protein
MSISDSEKIDFLWKKIIYGVTKTAAGTVKGGPNETIASPLPGYASNIWTQTDSSSIPTTPPVSNTSTVTVYKGATRLQLTSNPTSPANVSWLSNMTNFIPPTFSPSYQVNVYGGDPIHGAPLLPPGSSGFEWVFDYNAGVLNFDSGIPASVVANGVCVEIYQYTGSTLTDALAGIVTGEAQPPVTLTLNAATFANASVLIKHAVATSFVSEVAVNVIDAFDGGADLTVGDSGNQSRLMSNTNVDLTEDGAYITNPAYVYPSNTDVNAYLSGSPTVGNATVTLTWA